MGHAVPVESLLWIPGLNRGTAPGGGHQPHGNVHGIKHAATGQEADGRHELYKCTGCLTNMVLFSNLLQPQWGQPICDVRGKICRKTTDWVPGSP